MTGDPVSFPSAPPDREGRIDSRLPPLLLFGGLLRGLLCSLLRGSLLRGLLRSGLPCGGLLRSSLLRCALLRRSLLRGGLLRSLLRGLLAGALALERRDFLLCARAGGGDLLLCRADRLLRRGGCLLRGLLRRLHRLAGALGHLAADPLRRFGDGLCRAGQGRGDPIAVAHGASSSGLLRAGRPHAEC